MDDRQLKNIIEGLLFTAKQPLGLKELEKLLLETASFGCSEENSDGDSEHTEKKILREKIKQVLEELETDYIDRGVILKKVASGYRFQVINEVVNCGNHLKEKKGPKFSKAFLETLAVIAYRQPATRGDIESIRGVSVNTQIIKALLELQWIRVVGRKNIPGRPEMFATTKSFLDHFNLSHLEQLPTLAEVKNPELIF